MLTKERITEFENTYKKNMEAVWHWEKELVKPQKHDEWMITVRRRSQAMREIYFENQNQLDMLFKDLEEELEEDIREELYEMLLRLFFTGRYSDAVLMIHIANKLLPCYDAGSDDRHIINLLLVQSYITTEYFYRQSRYPEKFSYSTYHGRIHAYRSKYKELRVEERRIIMANYYNIICALPSLLPHELNYALDIYDDFLELEQEAEVREMDREEKAIVFRKEQIQIGVWNMAVILEHFDHPHLLHFYDMLRNKYEAIKENGGMEIPNILVSSYFYTSAYMTENQIANTGIGWKEAYDRLLTIAETQLETLERMELNTMDDGFLWDSYYPYVETTSFLFKVYHEQKAHDDNGFMREFINRGTEIFSKFPKDEYIWMMYGNYSEWCEYALSVLESPKDQEKLIKSIIVKGQIQTYIHSQMVALLANAIIEQIIQRRPDLLIGLPEYDAAKGMQENRERLHDYVSHAAIYHDIGKYRISAVINQQTRKLSDEEFALIRQHPEHPETGVLKDSLYFADYYDIIAGHHKSYDGRTGYPAYFDNVHSPRRILIDLITVCDCLDAATDRLGRNYTGGKDFKEVLGELKQGSGTKYNPDIVNLILENESLEQELDHIVNEGRDEVYYQTYKEYFS